VLQSMGITAKKYWHQFIDLKIRKELLNTRFLSKAWGAEIVVIHVTDPRHGIPGARIKEKELEIEEQATKNLLKNY